MSLFKAKHVDRDDFGADHYADFIRDTHRSRITLDQLDIAKRQQWKKEKLLSRIHYLKMKEHTRVKNDFIRKVEQDLRVANLPAVRETLKAQRKKCVISSPTPSNSNDQSQQVNIPAKNIDDKSHQSNTHRKTMLRSDSPKAERLKANLNKFNHMNSLIV